MDGLGTFTCQCKPGYSGATCATNVDDCSPNPCKNGGSCVDGVATYTCNCASGYSGTTCATNIDECSPNPCQNSGTCTDGIAGFTCACPAGYSGTTCATNIDECAPSPCKNGGTCTDGIAKYTCACASGYSGATCATNINDCSPNPCKNSGTCVDGVASYTCNCVGPYTGKNCELPRFIVISPAGESAQACDANVDGTVVVGQTGDKAFRWTASGGIQYLSGDRVLTSSVARVVSGDGSVVAGEFVKKVNEDDFRQAWRWTAAEGMAGLVSGLTWNETASGISDDGTVIVGDTNRWVSGAGSYVTPTVAYRWTGADGMTALGVLSGATEQRSRATRVSGNGSVIVGSSYNADGAWETARWTGTGTTWTIQGLGIPGAYWGSNAIAATTTGNVFLVQGSALMGPGTTYLWSSATSAYTRLGNGGVNSWGSHDMSADGSVVVGMGDSSEGAWVWTASDNQMHWLKGILSGFGVDMTNWMLAAFGISGDGNVVVGYGQISGGTKQAWVARWR